MNIIKKNRIVFFSSLALVILILILAYFAFFNNKAPVASLDEKIAASKPIETPVQKNLAPITTNRENTVKPTTKHPYNEPEKTNQEIEIKTPTSAPDNNPVELIGQKPDPIDSPAIFSDTENFTVATAANSVDNVGDKLLEGSFINNKSSFIELFSAKADETIAPGGYQISKKMNLAQIAKVLHEKPYMRWVLIPEGLRKEETALILANTLGWSTAQKEKWINDYTAAKPEYLEGVYFPDTYLIPSDEEPINVALRLQSKFNENFAIYLPEFSSQNIKWTTGLTLASLVQREATNSEDMPLIAGVLWNRLEQNMPLGVDATLQYLRGNNGNGWWAPISTKDKQTISPFNTYLNKGLPPRPICSPGIAAIQAVLNPAKTDCLYYLHDKNHITHCAKTYEEHLENIEIYLKTP